MNFSASNIVIYSLFGTRFRQMCVVLLCGKNSRCIGWLRTGSIWVKKGFIYTIFVIFRVLVTNSGRCFFRVIVSDWDARDAVTRRTSLDASTALISAKSSRRWSKRSAEERSRRDTVVYLHVPIKMDLQKPAL
uniref:Secreted protein n=1 Tax=Heterorhabditis bacteriophora TaxID=37862 RepID=A0A1I7X8W4_HETBA